MNPPRNGVRILLSWVVLGLALPLSHTWFLENRFLESSWGVLHGVWVLSCGLAFFFVSLRLDFRKGEAWFLLFLPGAVSYLVTWSATRWLVLPQGDARALVFLIAEFFALGSFFWWAGSKQNARFVNHCQGGRGGRESGCEGEVRSRC